MMTVDVFWQRMENAIMNSSVCGTCPVQEYADETGNNRFCDSCGDCADALKMLYKHLEQEVTISN